MSSKGPYRKIAISKIDWSNDEIETPILLKEIETELREALNNISEGKKINPHLIQSGLRSINFHKEHPEIYKVIEDLCLDYDIKGNDLSTDDIISYINSHLGENKTRNGTNVIFENLKDEKIGKISPESLHQIIEEIGDKMNIDDVKYLMQTIAEPSNDINISSEETYYIMTKKPADVVKITSLTKNM
jgi:Ca2+-binding EF-hand superfamily protein